jgi:hypothetical protein
VADENVGDVFRCLCRKCVNEGTHPLIIDALIVLALALRRGGGASVLLKGN